MGIKRFIPAPLRPGYMKKWSNSFKKGYLEKYDKDYAKKSKDYIRYQSVEKKKVQFESDIEITKGLAVLTREKEKELAELFKENKYSFEEPGVFLDPYGLTPLCAYVFFYTEKECSVRFLVHGKTKEYDISDCVKEPCKWHRVPVYGLYPDMENTVELELLDAEGKAFAKKELKMQTRPLPKSMLDMVWVEKKTVPSAMKLIFVAGKSTTFPMAFDENGDIRYLMLYRPRGYGFFELANGRFIMMERQTLLPTYMIPHSTQMYEIDYLGRVYRTYYVPNGIHHDVCEMTPGGNLLVASNSQCGHVEDCIAEINRYNGKVEKIVDFRDILKTTYRDRTNWVHVNAITYDPKTKNVVFSARNIHSIISVNWETNALNWILGDKEFWGSTPWAKKVLKTPAHMPWHYQQHSVKRIWEDLDGNPNTIHYMVFDNHWHIRRKVESFDDDEKSYVTIYTINEKAKTAKIEKRFGSIKSKITSNGALKLEEKRLFYMGGFLAFPEEHDNRGASISEFDYETGEELNRYNLKSYFFRAFEMVVNMDDLASAMDIYAEPCVGWLQNFDETDEKIEIPVKTIDEAPLSCQEERIRLQIEDGNLWVKSRDHLITRVYLVGEKNYVKDFRDPEQQQDLAADMEYFLSIPLYNISPGTYKLIVEFKGECFDTEKTIRLL